MMMIMVFVKKGFLGSWIVVETVGEEIDVDDEPMDEVITPVEFFYLFNQEKSIIGQWMTWVPLSSKKEQHTL